MQIANSLGSQGAGKRQSTPVQTTPPLANGQLTDLVLAEGVSVTVLSFISEFSGSDLVFSLAPQSPALPTGLTLTTGGVLLGAPTQIVTDRVVVVQATNSEGSAQSNVGITVFPLTFEASLSGLSDTTFHSPHAADATTVSALAASFNGPAPGPLRYQWFTLESGDIEGATEQSYAPVAADYDLEQLSCRVWSDIYPAQETPPVRIRRRPPSAQSALADVEFSAQSGLQSVATAGDFVGNGLTFSLSSAPLGVTIDPESGVLSVDTTVTALQANTPIVVRATNSGGFAETAFGLSIAEPDVEISQGAVTFRLTGSILGHGVDETGKPWVQKGSGELTLVSITPTQAVNSGAAIVNGAMLNPVRTEDATPPQGYDERMNHWDAGKNLSLPVTLSSGDVVIKTVAFDPESFPDRDGAFSAQAALHVVDTALSAGEVLDASVSYAGRTPGRVWPVDIDDWFASRTPLDLTGATLPPFSVLISALHAFSPTIAQVYNAGGSIGYEAFSCQGLGEDTAAGRNYGRYIGRMVSAAMIAMLAPVGAPYSEAEIKEIARAVLSLGVEWGFPILDSQVFQTPDGGHYQFHQGPLLFALHMTGRGADIESVMSHAPGNWMQAFRWTPSLRADLEPHDSLLKPAMARRRVLGSQPGGTVLRIPAEGSGNSGDDNQISLPAGTIVTDGYTEVTLASEFTFPGWNALGGSVDLPLSETNPFSPGDVVWMRAPDEFWITDGAYDWVVRGPRNPRPEFLGTWSHFGMGQSQIYRGLQEWTGQILACHAMGIMDAPTMDSVRGYMETANTPSWPSATNDYPTMCSTWRGYDVVDPAFAANWATVRSIPQRREFSAPTAVSLARVSTPGALAPLSDGMIVGLQPGKSSARVEISGTATGGEGTAIEYRVERHGDGQVIRDWTALATIESQGWTGIVSLPKADAWWRIAVRAAAAPGLVDMPTARWAVGYKFLVLGQSQVVLFFNTNAEPNFAMSAAGENRVSMLEWQGYNAGGSSVAESLTLINDAGPDGPRGFAEQFSAIDGTPAMIVREAVGGTSLIDFLDDSDTDRSWSDFSDKVDRYGGDFTALLQNWNTSNASPLNGDSYFDILTGADTHGTPVDHAITDLTQKGMAISVMPATRYSDNPFYADANFSAELIDHVNTVFPNRVMAPPISDYVIEDAGGPHPSPSATSNIRFGQRLAIAAARAVGSDTSQNPYFSGAGERSLDGKHIDIDVVLPNGGVLFSPNASAISGFEVSENGGVSFANTGFSAAIHGSNKVRLTKSSGEWTSAGLLAVRRVQTLGLNDPHDPAREQSIVSGELYETYAPDVLGLGLPVHGHLKNYAGTNRWHAPVFTPVSSIAQAATGTGVAPSIAEGTLQATAFASVTSTAEILGWSAAAGANRKVLVAVSIFTSGRDVESVNVTWGGTAMTNLRTQWSATSNPYEFNAVFELSEASFPSGGTGNIEVTLGSGTATNMQVIPMTVLNTSQSAPVIVEGSFGNPSSLAETITPVAEQSLIVGVAHSSSSASSAVWGSGLIGIDGAKAFGETATDLVGSAVSGPTAVTCAPSNFASGRGAIILAAFEPI